jgi:hypothetical protein
MTVILRVVGPLRDRVDDGVVGEERDRPLNSLLCESGDYLLDDLHVLLRHRLLPPCGYLSGVTALLDDPEVFVFLDDLFNAGFNVGGCMPGRDSETLGSRADLLPFLAGKSQADAAI